MNRKILSTLIISAFALAVPMDAALAAKKKPKKDVRSGMTEAQKKQLRKAGREWCLKQHAKGTVYIERIEIMSNGGIRCWLRG
jgi:hypothetical protein